MDSRILCRGKDRSRSGRFQKLAWKVEEMSQKEIGLSKLDEKLEAE
jgi:hypothetical protein